VKFQVARASGAMLHPLNNLPPHVFTDGYIKLQELAIAAAQIATTKPEVVMPAKPVVSEECISFRTSLFECYAGILLVPSFAHSKAPILP
jgi:hypothetical protein